LLALKTVGAFTTLGKDLSGKGKNKDRNYGDLSK
jgi:hypothetical protein